MTDRAKLLRLIRAFLIMGAGPVALTMILGLIDVPLLADLASRSQQLPTMSTLVGFVMLRLLLAPLYLTHTREDRPGLARPLLPRSSVQATTPPPIVHAWVRLLHRRLASVELPAPTIRAALGASVDVVALSVAVAGANGPSSGWYTVAQTVYGVLALELAVAPLLLYASEAAFFEVVDTLVERRCLSRRDWQRAAASHLLSSLLIYFPVTAALTICHPHSPRLAPVILQFFGVRTVMAGLFDFISLWFDLKRDRRLQAAPGQDPTPTGDRPKPLIAGLTHGDGIGRVIEALGRPDGRRTQGDRLHLHFHHGGLRVVCAKISGLVEQVVLTTAQASEALKARSGLPPQLELLGRQKSEITARLRSTPQSELSVNGEEVWCFALDEGAILQLSFASDRCQELAISWTALPAASPSAAHRGWDPSRPAA